MRVLAVAFAASCPPPHYAPQANVSVDAYLGQWFIQQQAVTKYLPASQNRCVSANYHKEKSFFGYDVKVHNVAYDVAAPHAVHDSKGKICAKVVGGGKLEVAPCFLPPLVAGPYWIMHFDEAKGLAVITGGPPKLESNGLCKNDPTNTNDSGFWIFTRQQAKDDALIEEGRSIGQKLGLDLSVLEDVDQTGCPPVPPAPWQPAPEVAEEPCCQGSCPAGTEKYYSIATSEDGKNTPHCGECCIKPSQYSVFHFFEKNLAKAESLSPCADNGYTQFDAVTTHGVWPVKVTFDLYDKPAMLHV